MFDRHRVVWRIVTCLVCGGKQEIIGIWLFIGTDVATMHVVVYDHVQQNVTNTNKHVRMVHGVNDSKCGVKPVTGRLLIRLLN